MEPSPEEGSQPDDHPGGATEVIRVPVYRDRVHAGRELAGHLRRYEGGNVTILGLAPGGVPVAAGVARALGVPLDALVVRRLSVRGDANRVVGALAPYGVGILSERSMLRFGVSNQELDHEVRQERSEVQRLELAYRGDRPFPAIRGRTVILVDDLLETGVRMRAALAAVGERQPSRVVVAVPVARPGALRMVTARADETVCPEPRDLPDWLVSAYENLPEVTEEEVRRFLGRVEDHAA